MKKLVVKEVEVNFSEAECNFFENDMDTISQLTIYIIDKIDNAKWGFVSNETREMNDIALKNKTGIIYTKFLIDFELFDVKYDLDKQYMEIRLSSAPH